jgi:hypothetical protein
MNNKKYLLILLTNTFLTKDFCATLNNEEYHSNYKKQNDTNNSFINEQPTGDSDNGKNIFSDVCCERMIAFIIIVFSIIFSFFTISSYSFANDPTIISENMNILFAFNCSEGNTVTYNRNNNLGFNFTSFIPAHNFTIIMALIVMRF